MSAAGDSGDIEASTWLRILRLMSTGIFGTFNFNFNMFMNSKTTPGTGTAYIEVDEGFL